MILDKEKKKEIEEKYTKYEIARILGARALQISMNAPVLIKLSSEELEQINFDSFKIAEAEFYSDILPITVKRPFPQKKEEKAMIFKIEKKKEETEKSKEEEKIEEEKIEIKEEEVIKEEAEIMELATPTDEVEEEAAAGEEESIE